MSAQAGPFLEIRNCLQAELDNWIISEGRAPFLLYHDILGLYE